MRLSILAEKILEVVLYECLMRKIKQITKVQQLEAETMFQQATSPLDCETSTII